ncbi:Hsp70 family protein [Stappia sp. F7233]|uniref:Hsp70 family protein n=1 Tax=Stappia albiluteola TaxID=2758565 RepID=A0A839AGM7_9HYPH|nr:Hsp70 family protein [Stappia albiluteola]MBA5777699.1 Hsp70 family protein [Stappia albiluteola]
MSASPPCGIDFGTSNSTVALAEGTSSRLLALEGDSVVLPSAIFFSFEENDIRFGREAVRHYVEGVEGRLMRSLKSVLGTQAMGEKTAIKAQRWSFAEIIGLYLKELRRRGEEACGVPLEQVVLGRPVFFIDRDEVADRRAQDELEAIARDAGFREIEFQFEPIAAALDYERQVTGEELAVIIDLGGGTSDFSIVRVSPERRRRADRREDILASSGVHVGGTDFDQLLSMRKVMPELGHGTPARDGKRDLPSWAYFELATWHRINFLYTPQAAQMLKELRYDASEPERVQRLIDLVEERLGHALAGAVEGAKVGLSANDDYRMHFGLMNGSLDIAFSRGELEGAIDGAVTRVGAALDECLKLAGVGEAEISTVFLTGGSASIPFVRQSLTGKFREAHVVQGDVFGSVGSGLALDARRKFGRALAAAE